MADELERTIAETDDPLARFDDVEGLEQDALVDRVGELTGRAAELRGTTVPKSPSASDTLTDGPLFVTSETPRGESPGAKAILEHWEAAGVGLNDSERTPEQRAEFEKLIAAGRRHNAKQIGLVEDEAEAAVRRMGEEAQERFERAMDDPEQVADIRERAQSVSWAQLGEDGTILVVTPEEFRAKLRQPRPSAPASKAPAAVRVIPRARSQLLTVRPRARASAAQGGCRAGPDDDGDLDGEGPPGATVLSGVCAAYGSPASRDQARCRDCHDRQITFRIAKRQLERLKPRVARK